MGRTLDREIPKIEDSSKDQDLFVGDRVEGRKSDLLKS